MTNAECVDTYLKHRGMVQCKGTTNVLSSLMFYFLMDASYQVFINDVKKLPVKRKAKQCLTRIKNSFDFFLAKFRAAFSGEQLEYILDKVDAFEEWLAHDLWIAKIGMMEACNHLPIDQQEKIASLWLCHLLASDAQDMYGECYLNSSREPQKDYDIGVVASQTKELSRLIFPDEERITQKQFDRVQLAVKVLAKKICEYIYNDYKIENNVQAS